MYWKMPKIVKIDLTVLYSFETYILVKGVSKNIPFKLNLCDYDIPKPYKVGSIITVKFNTNSETYRKYL